MNKITSATIAPNPYKLSLRAHERLDFMLEARLENGVIQRKFFARKLEAKQWLGRQYFLKNICEKDANNALH